VFNPEEENTELSIFPNPADDKIFVKFNSGQINDEIEVVIYDMVGNEVITLTNVDRNEFIVSTSKLPSGVYICKIANLSGKGHSVNKRFVISR